MSRYRLSRRAREDIRAIWAYIGVERGSPDGANKQSH